MQEWREWPILVPISESGNTWCLSFITDEAEFLEAAFAVEQESVEVSIDTAVAITCGYKLAILDFMDGSVWIRKNYGRVGGYDDLGSFLDHIFDPQQELQLVLERQRRLGFIKDVDAFAGQSVFKQGHESFTVGEFMEIEIVIVDVQTSAIDFADDVVVALGPEEIRVIIAQAGLRCNQRLVQRRMGLLGMEVEVSGAALGIDSQQHRNRFKQRRFPRPVTPNDVSHRLLKPELSEIPDHRNRERIFTRVPFPLTPPDSPQINILLHNHH